MSEPERPGPDAELDAELSAIERAMERRTDPGPTALTVSITMLVLLVSLVLPWTGSVLGWQVLTGAAPQLGPLPRLFVLLALGFGLVCSALALATSWWALAWLSAVGCGFCVVAGLWALWSRQVGVPQGGTPAHVGMILAVLAMVVLAACWVRISLRR